MGKLQKPDAMDFNNAMCFFQMYCKEHQFFTGGDVLEAFRKTFPPGYDRDWRNVWSSVIADAKAKGFIVKAGRTKPTSKQSHTATLVQWQSRLFEGEQSLVGKTSKEFLEDLRKKVVTKKIGMMDALWKAYEHGKEGGG